MMARKVTTREDAAAVIALYNAELPNKQLSAQMGASVSVFQKLVKPFVEEGEVNVPTPHPRSGRPKLISPRTQKVISRKVKANPRLTACEV